jgi:Zn finger protein HypA/HybF involved in hydrogenase expression
MNRSAKRYLLLVVAIGLGLLALAVANGQNGTMQRWHPRRVPADAVFVGDKSCLECHKKFSPSASTTGMAMAMEAVATSKVLSRNPRLSMRVGPYTYEITRTGKQSVYSVTDGKDTISLPISYTFGAGRMGQTYLLERDGKVYESLVSFYSGSNGLDFTTGADRTVPPSLTDAVGRLLTTNEVANCFSCHATGAVVSGSQLRLDNFTHGVRCEACHGPGGRHIAAVKAGDTPHKSIYSPGLLGGDELAQHFCGSCHRSAEEFSLLKSMEINNVRFQPYRIFNSKCYSDDRKISCTACHNPHEPLREDSAYYDKRCLECHSLRDKTAKVNGDGKSCPVADKDCTSCHMPKTEIPAAHFKFTDHYIRVVRPGEKYPS